MRCLNVWTSGTVVLSRSDFPSDLSYKGPRPGAWPLLLTEWLTTFRIAQPSGCWWLAAILSHYVTISSSLLREQSLPTAGESHRPHSKRFYIQNMPSENKKTIIGGKSYYEMLIVYYSTSWHRYFPYWSFLLSTTESAFSKTQFNSWLDSRLVYRDKIK